MVLALLLVILVCPFTLAGTLYVNANGLNPVPPFTDWSSAATNIQDAIEVANVGDRILVTNGVYRFGGRTTESTQSNRVALVKGVSVVSINGPKVTFIEGAMGQMEPRYSGEIA